MGNVRNVGNSKQDIKCSALFLKVEEYFTLQSPTRFFKFNIVTLLVPIYTQYLLLVVKFD